MATSLCFLCSFVLLNIIFTNFFRQADFEVTLDEKRPAKAEEVFDKYLKSDVSPHIINDLFIQNKSFLPYTKSYILCNSQI